ncbi:hypothetical protein J2751_000018 [Halorubrum alkaliphilum]|uniref:Uncharacterized protein n=1 Tax=Halorubrum alkaliphilum TaxID=261290 RepID=A0A8T4GD38_9EURY|nr:hypothetical protein [Halorubrum alkaliphilum]MBP1921035.1 hypothetical protein [Halorubrum alkaliphilum]
MFDALFPNWTNPEAIAVLIGLRLVCNVAMLAYVAHVAEVRSGYTATMGGLVAFSTVATAVLLTTGWGGQPLSYVELVSQVLVLGLSGYVALRVDPSPASVALLLAWPGAVLLLLAMVPVYGEAFVAP